MEDSSIFQPCGMNTPNVGLVGMSATLVRRAPYDAVMDRWRIAPGASLDLTKVDPDSTKGAPGNKAKTEKATADLQDQIAAYQEKLWAEQKRSLLVVLQAIDAGGKDGTVKHVFGHVNPQGCDVTSFKAPNDDEQAHDFLWRVHKVTPAKGHIGIFNRSHYEDVLIVRVHDLVPKAVWRRRYTDIKAFERNLTEGGTTVVKFFLHISKAEQAKRFRARLDDPTKCWKFNIDDLKERALWDDYRLAFEDAITATSTKESPWYVVPANHKWFRNWVISTVLVKTLEAMDPQFPPPDPALAGVVIED
jgi:PPK2 family polyphosphate:nucleotide phosphotransferase